MEKGSFILRWILVSHILIFCIDAKPTSFQELSTLEKDTETYLTDNVNDFSTFPSKGVHAQTTDSFGSSIRNESSSANMVKTPNIPTISGSSVTEENISSTEIIPTSKVSVESENSSNVILENVHLRNQTALDVQPLLAEFLVTNMFPNFNDSIVIARNFSDSLFVSTDSSNSIMNNNKPTAPEFPVASRDFHESSSVTEWTVSEADSLLNDSNYLSFENSPETLTIPSEDDKLSLTSAIPVTTSVFPSNVSAAVIELSSVTVSVSVDSSNLNNESSEASTISVSDDLEQQSLVTELLAESTFLPFDVSTTVVEATASVSKDTSPSHSNSDYSKAATASSITTLFEADVSSRVPDIMDTVSTETSSQVGTVETNDTADGENSVCSVCQNCTDGYIDRVISDVTAGLPKSLELPNRQGRLQLYHGQLFGLNTLKRSEKALVACLDKHHYAVMVPLHIQNAKAFYKWQVEMPLRTFYGDLNVTVADTECRVFYSHSKGESLVDGLKITALDGIQTEFSGVGPLNGLMASFTRTWISVFRRSFAKTIENTLVHVINKELQDVKKYEEFYEKYEEFEE